MSLHKHHIIPRHAGGTDDRSNIEMVTVEQHAGRHRILFETHGHWQDFVAWKAISGQIPYEEATRRAIILGNNLRKGEKRGPMSEKHKKALSVSVSKTQTGKKKGPYRWKIAVCPNCSASGNLNIMKRDHFERCPTRS